MPSTKTTKPKCGKGQSCGFACIEAKDTCKEKISPEDSVKLVTVIDNLSKYKDKSVESFDNSDFGKTFEELAVKYPFTNDIGHETEKLDSATVHHFTLPASDGSSDTLVYSAVIAGSKGFTVSDGYIKEYTASDRQGLYKEALAAALRAKAEQNNVLSSAPIASGNAIADNNYKDGQRFNPAEAKDLEPGKLNSLGDYNVDADKAIGVIDKAVKQKGLSYSEDEVAVLGKSIRSWLSVKGEHSEGAKNDFGYQELSKLMYSPDDSSDLKDKAVERGVFTNAVQALKILPSVTVKQLSATYKDMADKDSSNAEKSAPTTSSTKSMNRWITLSKESDVVDLLAKYQKGETITEQGMFGVTHLNADDMEVFAGTSNVKYIVQPKLDGTGRGKAVDSLKSSTYEGEVLFVPGTKFEVVKVDNGGFGVAVPAKTLAQIDEITKLPDGPDKDNATRKYWTSAKQPGFVREGGNSDGEYFGPKDVLTVQKQLNDSDWIKNQPDIRAEIATANGIPKLALVTGENGDITIDKSFLKIRPVDTGIAAKTKQAVITLREL